MTMIPLTKHERNFLDRWDADRALDEWASYLSEHPHPWTTTTEWDAPRASQVFHPSELANPCDMFLLCQLEGAPEQKFYPASKHKIFSLGTAIHIMMDYYQGTRAQEFGYEYQAEVSVRHPELPMKGHIDCATKGWPFPNRKIIWDYKSISGAALSRLSNIPAGYLIQLTAYMAMAEVPAAILLYINKETGGFFPRIIHFSESLWQSVINRVTDIMRCGEGGTLPQRNVSSQCRHCRYFEACEPPIEKR